MKTIDFDIPKKEALRYAGNRGDSIPEGLDSLADEVIAECKKAVTPRNIVRRYRIKPAENGVALADFNIVLQGKDIKKHLENCEECYIMCATAGIGADNFIRTMMAADSVRGILADGAATAAVESYCDSIEKELRRGLAKEKKFLTWRYSPGYGDFPFTQQPEILSLLDASKYTGVYCGESCIMTPSKSVTAVMGIADEKPKDRKRKCDNCPNRDNCDFSCR